MYKLQMHRQSSRQREKHAEDEENAGSDTAQLTKCFLLNPQHTNTKPLHRWERGV